MTPRKRYPKKAGRKPIYSPAHAKQAYKLALLGSTEAQLAAFFEVSESTIDKWKVAHPEFLRQIRRGKEQADASVAESLYKRACGYRHRAVKIITVAQGAGLGSVVEEIPYVEHYPPDTGAAVMWLKNRQPKLWRDKQEIEHSADESLAALIASTPRT